MCWAPGKVAEKDFRSHKSMGQTWLLGWRPSLLETRTIHEHSEKGRKVTSSKNAPSSDMLGAPFVASCLLLGGGHRYFVSRPLDQLSPAVKDRWGNHSEVLSSIVRCQCAEEHGSNKT